MRRGALALVVALAGLVTVGLAIAGTNFSVRLTGEAERPIPVETDGKGRAVFHLSKDGSALSYKLIVNHLEDITQAHIHCGSPEVAGPVVAFLFGFNAAGVTQNGVLATGTITDADVIDRPSSTQCPGGVSSFAEMLEKIQSGEAYVNVHTIEFPAGEIRGNF
jgi:hypothetical protein